MGLAAILDWNMTVDQAEVFHIALAYEQEFRDMFGRTADGQSFRRNSLPLRSDPRKSNLYRQCWKLRRETRGLIPSSEYRNYIHGNMYIFQLKGREFEPSCITGPKSWIRYKVWRRGYDRQLAEAGAQAPPPSISTTSPKIIIAIDSTRKFLAEKCGGQPTFEQIRGFIESGFFKIWVASNKVSPYYLALSPFVERTGKVSELFSVCSSSEAVFREKLTKEVKDYFKHEYRYEFDNS